MDRCMFCQGDLEPGTRRCRQCGQTQPEPLTDPPPENGGASASASFDLTEMPADRASAAGTAASGVPLNMQSKLTDIPTRAASGEAAVSDTPGVQERASLAPSDAQTEASEALTQRCPACHKELPERAHFCSACGHRLSDPAGQVGSQSAQEATAPAAVVIHQESAGPPAPQTVSAVQQTPPPELGTSLEQEAAPPREGVAGAAAPEDHAPGKGSEAGKEEQAEEEEEGPIATFRKRRIAFKTLSLPVRILLLITLTQIGLVAVLLATQTLPQPVFNSGEGSGGETVVVSLAAFLMLAVSLGVGSAFALAGAMRVHWSVRFLVVALVTGVLGYNSLNELLLLANINNNPFALDARLRWAQLAVLAGFWAWAIGVSVVRWRARRKSPQAATQSAGWQTRTFWSAIALIFLYFGLEFAIWVAWNVAGMRDEALYLFRESISFQSELLLALLTLLVYWSSTDLLEWTDLIAKGVVASTRRLRAPWALPILTSLATVGMLINTLRLAGTEIILSVIIAAALAGLVTLVARFAGIHADWPKEVPALAILLGAIFLYTFQGLSSLVSSFIATAIGLPQAAVFPLEWVLALFVALLMLTIGLLLLARGRMGQHTKGAAVGLFLVLLVLLSITDTWEVYPMAAGFSVPNPPLHLLSGFIFLTALGTLVLFVWLLARRRPPAAWTAPLKMAFLLLAGLQAIDWLHDLPGFLSSLGSLSPLLLAGVFLLTVLWDFITSGEQVTNSDSPAFPREGRVLLYLGYTLVGTATLLYAASLRVGSTGAPAGDTLNSIGDASTALGVFLLGVPVVALSFILRVRRREPRAAIAATAPHRARPGASRGVQRAIVGSGALAIVLIALLAFDYVLPRVAAQGAAAALAPYTAGIPGGDCDHGGAVWTIPPSQQEHFHCLATGLQITAGANANESLSFSPPGARFPKNYRVVVHVDESSLPDGYVSIDTRYSKAGLYEHRVYASGAWLVIHIGLAENQSSILDDGEVAPSPTYTIEATADGPNLRLMINGVEVSTVSDTAFTATNLINLNVTNRSKTLEESTVLSNFVFKPLPVRSLPSAGTVYRTATPGPGCDKSAGQWLLTKPATATTRCQATGMQLEAMPKSWGQITFLPPSFVVPHNYRASVQVHLSDVPQLCAGIITRASGLGSYAQLVCRNGWWGIILESLFGDSPILQSGTVTPANTYTIEATADGANQGLIINGAVVAQTSDTTYTTDAFLGLAVSNAAIDAGTVLFSNFVFMPLP